MNFLFILFLFERALAEFGLVAVSSSDLINGAPVRIKDGHLVFCNDEPLLQASFVNDKVVLSDKIVAASAVGAGIGPNAAGRMSVLSSPAHKFNQTKNFLSYDESVLFSVKKTDDGSLSLFVDWMNPEYRGIPVMLRITELVYLTPISNITRNKVVDNDLSPQVELVESDLIESTTSIATAAPTTERPTVFSTVYETILIPRTQTDPKTSTVTLYQEIVATFTTETVTALSTPNAGSTLDAEPVNRLV